MNNAVLIPKPDELNNYMEFLFDGLEGYMYVIAKIPEDPESWDQVFFQYPEQKNQAIKAINAYRADHEIYIAPVLYKSQRAVKETFKVTQVLWCDFDGNTPDTFDIPPSMVIQTSEDSHTHAYWKLDQPLEDSASVEELNRRLTFKYDSDASGWDITQVLRPPYTTNHKHGGLNVATREFYSELTFNLAVFDELAPAPEKNVDYGLWEKLDLPDLGDVIYAHRFGPDFKRVFEMQKHDVADRSAALSNMAFICAEAGLNDKEIYVVISHLATRWEKFKHHTRDSRARQLIGIIEHVRIKYPNNNMGMMDEVFEYSPRTLLQTDIKIEWLIQDMLMKAGVMVFAGPSGVGKSQFAMFTMAHLAAGKNFMGYEVGRPLKVGFFSLEMGDMEVKHFLETMWKGYEEHFTPEELDLMDANWKIIPFGEAVGINTTGGQDLVVKYVEENDWDILFIDSIGSSILGNINDMSTVQPFTNFNDKLRKRYGISLWYIHHFRKPPPGTKSLGGQEDSYGDQYITARATSVYTLIRDKSGNLKVRNPKNRHAKEQPDFLIQRDENLFFTHLGSAEVSDEDVPDPIKQQIFGEKPTKGDASPMPFGN